LHRRIGVIGGLSPESTVAYYTYITRTYSARYGDHSYPEIVIFSVSFQSFVNWCNEESWDKVAMGLIQAGLSLEGAGVDVVVIAANTMHLVYEKVQAALKVPVLNLLDALADDIEAAGVSRVGLLGTRFTMEKPLFSKALAERGIHVLVPEPAARAEVNRIIYDELVSGEIHPASRQSALSIIDDLGQRGAQGVVLGCTELPLLIHDGDTDLRLFDTTRIHAEAVLRFAMTGG
jgi:aspartate racemase